MIEIKPSLTSQKFWRLCYLWCKDQGEIDIPEMKKIIPGLIPVYYGYSDILFRIFRFPLFQFILEYSGPQFLPHPEGFSSNVTYSKAHQKKKQQN